jgi:hypothetical protein
MPWASRDIGHEHVVADELAFVANQVGQHLPTFQVVLGHSILDRNDRIARDELGKIVHLLLSRANFALALIAIGTILEKLGRGGIERERQLRLPRRQCRPNLL